MVKSFKEFLKDYVKVQKESNKWLKKHWKGYLILIAVCYGAEMAYLKHLSNKNTKELEDSDQD